MTLLQIEEKNAHKRVIVCLTFLGKIPRIGQVTIVALRCGNRETLGQQASSLTWTLNSEYLKNIFEIP